jgi:RHS repeat-associated protein
VQSVVEYSYLQGSDLLTGWSSNEGNSHTRTFEQNRNLITGIENQHGTNLISSFAYTNDELGRRTARVDSATVTNTFGYNQRSEVISAIMGVNDHGYAYDPIGNRLHAILNGSTNTYTANELNQYTNVSNGVSVAPVFDDDGNMVEYGDWSFAWDGENRLIEVASNSVTVVQNHYDYMSRRIMKATATQTNTYLYDGWNLLAETTGSSTNYYIWGLDLSQSMQGAGGVGGLLMAVLDGDAYCPGFDANGNVTDYTDASGTTVARYEYDPFGKVSAQSGSMADDFVYRFSTKYADDETGLVYYGYRYLNPDVGRWINRDPIVEDGGMNLYGFAANSPLSHFDILGLLGCFECGSWSNVGGPYWELTRATTIQIGINCEYTQYQRKSRPCRFCCVSYTDPGTFKLRSTSCTAQGSCPSSPGLPNCW